MNALLMESRACHVHKVLLVGPLTPPSGGVATVTRGLLRSELPRQFDLVHLDISTRGGIPQQGHFRPVNFGAAARQLAAYQRALTREQPALVHLPVSGTLSGFLRDSAFVRLASSRGIPLVGHVHGSQFPALFDRGPAALRRLVRATFRRIDVTLALSPTLARFFADRGITEAVTVVPNAVDDEFLGALPERVPVPRPARGDFHVLFIGALRKEKGVYDLAAAATEVIPLIPGARFTLVGPEVEPHALARLTAMCREAGIADRVRFPGPLYGEAKVQAFLDADALCLPSYFEAFPCAILEGMAAGLPIVSTRVAGIPDMVVDDENGWLVTPGDVPALSRALRRLAADPTLRRAMGERNAAVARTRYTLPVVAERLAAIYRQLLVKW